MYVPINCKDIMSEGIICPETQAVLKAYDEVVALVEKTQDAVLKSALQDAQLFRFQRVVDMAVACGMDCLEEEEVEDVDSVEEALEKIAEADVLTEEALDLMTQVIAFSSALPYLHGEDRAEALNDLPEVYAQVRILLEGLCSEDGESCS